MSESNSGTISEATLKTTDVLSSAALESMELTVEHAIETNLIPASAVVPEYKGIIAGGDLVIHLSIGGVAANQSTPAAVTVSAQALGWGAAVAATKIIKAVPPGAISSTVAARAITALVPIGVGFVVGQFLSKAYQAEYDYLTSPQVYANQVAVELAINNFSNAAGAYIDQQVNSVVTTVGSLSSSASDYTTQVSNSINQTISNVATYMTSSLSSFLTSLGVAPTVAPTIDLSGVDPWTSEAVASLAADAPSTDAQAQQDLDSYIALNAQGAPVDFASALQLAEVLDSSAQSAAIQSTSIGSTTSHIVTSQGGTADTVLANGLTIIPLSDGGFTLVSPSSAPNEAIFSNMYDDLGQIISQTANESDGTSQITVYNSDGSSKETSYSSQNGTGVIEGTDVQTTSGTSQITVDGTIGASVTLDFSGTGGADTILEYDSSSGTSASVPYDPNFDLLAGDSIDFANVGYAIAGSFGGNDMLVLDESGGGVSTLYLDQSQSYSNDAFFLSSDGSGGTEITAESADQPIAFTGAAEDLLVVSPGSLVGTISAFLPGDTIDLSGVSADSVTLGAGNVLTLQQSGGSAFSLGLDPTQNYGGDNLLFTPDGAGGTDLGVVGGGYSFTGGNQTLLVLNPQTAGVPINGSFAGGNFAHNFQPTDTIDLAGIAPSSVSQDENGFIGVDIAGANSSSSFIGITGGNSPITANIVSDGNGGADIVALQDKTIVYTYSGNVVTGTASNGQLVQEPGITASLTFDMPLGYTTAGSSTGYYTYYTYGTDYGIFVPSLVDWSISFSGETWTQSEIQPDAALGYRYEFNVGFNNGQLETFGLNAVITDFRAFITSTGDTETFDTPVGTYGPSYVVGTNSTPGTWTSVISVPCYTTGTHITTERGEILVEQLAIDDLVHTYDGQAVPVRWIGFRRVDCRNHPRPHDVWPVRICPDAFGPAQPDSDLWLSPDHAVYIDGVLIPVRYLINGRTIAQEPRDTVTYWHVELERHDVILAEGLPCESFLDTGNRSAFTNGGYPIQLHPEFAASVWEAKGCAPLILYGAELEATRSYLLARAELLGHRMTREPRLRLLVGEQEVEAEKLGRCYHFNLPYSVNEVRLVSRSAVPAETRCDSTDHRQLGVAVSRIWLDGREVRLESAALGAGWHQVEEGWRWTDGCASLVTENARTLQVELVMTGNYWEDAVDDRAALVA